MTPFVRPAGHRCSVPEIEMKMTPRPRQQFGLDKKIDRFDLA
jgi:hypothetical protein